MDGGENREGKDGKAGIEGQNSGKKEKKKIANQMVADSEGKSEGHKLISN